MGTRSSKTLPSTSSLLLPNDSIHQSSSAEVGSLSLDESRRGERKHILFCCTTTTTEVRRLQQANAADT
jgi:hypothetical protein